MKNRNDINPELKKVLNKLERQYQAYEKTVDEANCLVNDICDFKAAITFVSGDRHLVLNEDSGMNVAPLYCLIGKNEDNKLSEEEHKSNCI